MKLPWVCDNTFVMIKVTEHRGNPFLDIKHCYENIYIYKSPAHTCISDWEKKVVLIRAAPTLPWSTIRPQKRYTNKPQEYQNSAGTSGGDCLVDVLPCSSRSCQPCQREMFYKVCFSARQTCCSL